ncbi:MAG: universal stress protein [Caldilineae bacterium]|nr:universal stress protein [Chloroflexota bacterium]MCB9177445.1 universal stress protein [Caldilineae bacterium]
MSSSEAKANASPRIVVPLDESARAEIALELATTIARRRGARLDLVTVPLLHQVELEQRMHHVEFPEQPPTLPSAEELVRMSQAEAAQYLSEVEQRLSAQGIGATAHLVDRAPAEAIVATAEAVDAELIVMATHGRGGMSRWALGSVADKVLQTARRPILLVRQPTAWGEAGPRTIAVALDGSGLAERVLPQAEAMARSFGAAITLVRIVVQYESEQVRMRWDGQERDSEDLRESWARQYLDRQAAALRERGFAVTTEVLPAENVAEALLEIDQRDAVGLLAMTTHGLGGLRRWAFGSVADRVLRSAETPVLLVRCTQDGAEDLL